MIGRWRRLLALLLPGGAARGETGAGGGRGASGAGGDPGGRTTVCGLCGRTFREDRGQPACRSCPLARACRYVRCPSCGYENPVAPGWLARREASS